MNNKLVGILVVILLVILGTYAVLAYNSTYNAKVGSSSVSIPDGFEVNKTSDDGTVIKNNETKYTLYEYPKGKTVESFIDEYHVKNVNATITNKTYALGAVNLTSITIQDGKKQSGMYVYDKNEKVYQIKVQGKYNKTALQKMVNTTTINPIPFI